MLNHQTILRCSHSAAFLIFFTIGGLFTYVGCSQIYKIIGLTDDQVATQVAADQTDRQKIIEGIRITTTDIILTTIAGLGAIASGFLAKWLGTEKKINKAIIAGVESAGNPSAKEAIHKAAVAAGIQSKLHARVKSLT